MSPLLLAARLDWGLDNPNKTAALIAMLMVGIWVLPFVYRPLFWLALVVFTGLGVCLMQTASRGGLAALAIGLGCLALFAPRPWPRARMAGLMVAGWIIIGGAVWLQTSHRLAQGIGSEDKSISHRLELWRVAPRMMVDAPGGWGFGNAGAAFMQWYQPVDRTEGYRTLVNSHLTWLVEMGWAGRFLYVFGWLTILALCWPEGGWNINHSHPAWLAIPFGIWIAFAISAWFSSVAESPWLWAVPLGSLPWALGWRVKTRRWPRQLQWLASAGISCALLAALFILGSRPVAGPRLRLSGSRMVLGEAVVPEVWLVADPATLGNAYGRTLRGYLQTVAAANPAPLASVGIVKSVSELPVGELQSSTMVVAGTLSTPELAQLKAVAPRCGKLILLNPAFFPQDLAADPQTTAKIEVVSGEFSHVSASAWAEAMKRPPLNVEGAGDFLPRWPELVFNN